ncbi:MAG TPA: hypothetical protein VIL46_18315 [Gemmataceae bacterium]
MSCVSGRAAGVLLAAAIAVAVPGECSAWGESFKRPCLQFPAGHPCYGYYPTAWRAFPDFCNLPPQEIVHPLPAEVPAAEPERELLPEPRAITRRGGPPTPGYYGTPETAAPPAAPVVSPYHMLPAETSPVGIRGR